MRARVWRRCALFRRFEFLRRLLSLLSSPSPSVANKRQRVSSAAPFCLDLYIYITGREIVFIGRKAFSPDVNHPDNLLKILRV